MGRPHLWIKQRPKAGRIQQNWKIIFPFPYRLILEARAEKEETVEKMKGKSEGTP
jgi:hypothetical protein